MHVNISTYESDKNYSSFYNPTSTFPKEHIVRGASNYSSITQDNSSIPGMPKFSNSSNFTPFSEVMIFPATETIGNLTVDRESHHNTIKSITLNSQSHLIMMQTHRSPRGIQTALETVPWLQMLKQMFHPRKMLAPLQNPLPFTSDSLSYTQHLVPKFIILTFPAPTNSRIMSVTW